MTTHIPEVVVRRYQTLDGQEFKSLKEAEAHQSALMKQAEEMPLFQALDKLAINLSGEDQDWDGCMSSPRELFRELALEACARRKFNPLSV